MQTSSTLLLLANFLAVSMTAGINALGPTSSAAHLELPLQFNISNQGTPILSTNRGSGRINPEQPKATTTAWRGSGRIESDAESSDNHWSEATLAWRGSGRVEPDAANWSSQVGPNVAWRGSGRLDSIQTDVSA